MLRDGRLSGGVGARVALAVPPATLTPASRAAQVFLPLYMVTLLSYQVYFFPAVGVLRPRVDGGGQGRPAGSMHRRGAPRIVEGGD